MDAKEREAAAKEAIEYLEERDISAIDRELLADERESKVDERVLGALEREVVAHKTQLSTSNPSTPRIPSLHIVRCWDGTVRRLSSVKGRSFNLIALLRDCDASRVRVSDDETSLLLPFRHVHHAERMRQELSDPGVVDVVERAIETHFGTRLRIVIKS